METNELFEKLKTNFNGISEEEADERLEEYGPNTVAQEQRHGRLILLGKACLNPLVILLTVARRGLLCYRR